MDTIVEAVLHMIGLYAYASPMLDLSVICRVLSESSMRNLLKRTNLSNDGFGYAWKAISGSLIRHDVEGYATHLCYH